MRSSRTCPSWCLPRSCARAESRPEHAMAVYRSLVNCPAKVHATALKMALICFRNLSDIPQEPENRSQSGRGERPGQHPQTVSVPSRQATLFAPAAQMCSAKLLMCIIDDFEHSLAKRALGVHCRSKLHPAATKAAHVGSERCQLPEFQPRSLAHPHSGGDGLCLEPSCSSAGSIKNCGCVMFQAIRSSATQK